MNARHRQVKIDNLWQQGRKLQQEGNLDQAIAIFKQLIIINPRNSEAYHFLGECLTQQNQLSLAIAAYQQAIKLNPKNPWSHHCLSLTWFWQGDNAAAANSSRRSIELESHQFAFHVQLGQCLTGSDPTKAIAAYQKAIELNANVSEEIYLQLIELLVKQAQIERVLDLCAIALNKYPNAAAIHYERGKAFAKQQQWQTAIASYSQAVLQPNYYSAYQGLGDALTQLDQHQDAKQAYQLAEDRFYQAQKFSKSDLPQDFDWQIYLKLNPEFNFTTKFEAIAHLIDYGLKENKLYALKHLHNPTKRPDIARQSLIPAQRIINNNLSQSKKLAVLVHIYYFDLWSELSSRIKNIQAEFDLYINLVASIWQPEMHQQILIDFPHAKIIISPNRGRDLGGYLSLMGHLDFANYNLFCLLHTKKSPHIDERISNIWRNDLLDAILGSPQKTQHNLAIMEQYSQFGMMGSCYWRSTAIGDNLSNYQNLLDRFAIKPKARNCEYLSGTMMLIRPQIMQLMYQKLQRGELESDDNQNSSFYIDGQLAHAIERIIGNLVRDCGLSFFWQK